MTQSMVDVVIIGGGPAGLYAAFYAGLRDLTVTVLEAQDELGGKINFYPEKFVWDVGALPATRGIDVRTNLIQQAQTFNANFYTSSKAVEITKEKNIFYVEDEHGRIHPGRTVLFAIGGGIISPKKLTVPIDTAVQNHVYYAFPDYHLLKNTHIIVSGGGDGAVDYANECLKFTDTVTIIYRGEKLKAHEASITFFKNNGGKIILSSDIRAIHKSPTQRMELILDNHTTLTGDHLLVQHGHNRDSSFLDKLALEFNKEQDFYLACDEPTITNIPGCFAAGDIQFSKGKVYLLAGAFQEAALSINQIKRYLDPESYEHGMVSSHNEKFDDLNQALINE
ncbi:NAD(P)/FAD-dependent oxidoreductase [Enterococcus sp.]|uniref:NAD(P)/FAD-dependent oxidoreductase n=1 Tax=Enterococcus sp. TaxID=35783 RepID=UPI002FCA54A9